MPVGQEARIGFGVCGLCKLTPFASGVFNQNDVAVLRKNAPGAVFTDLCVGGRYEAHFFVGKLVQAAAIAVDDVRIERRSDRIV